jgi:hypothetical protein
MAKNLGGLDFPVSITQGGTGAITGPAALLALGAASTATTIAVNGTANEIASTAGAQDLSANRAWTLSLPTALTFTGKTITGGAYASASATLFTFTTGTIGTAVTGVTQAPATSNTTIATTAYVDAAVTAGGGGLGPFVEVTTTSQAIAVNTRYSANNVGLVTFTLPAAAAIGDTFLILGKGAGLFAIAQNASQIIRSEGQGTTVGVGGSLTSVQRYNSIRVTCITANTDWEVEYMTGNFTIV